MKISAVPILARMASRNIWRNPRRTFFTLVAISVALWGSVTLASLARGIASQMAEDAISELTGHIKIQTKEYRKDPVVEHSFEPDRNAVVKLTRELPLKGITTRVKVPGVIVSERESFGVSIVGIDPEEEVNISFIGDGVVQGRMLSGSRDTGVIVGKRLLEELETNLDKRVVLMTRGEKGDIVDRGFRIVGVFDAELESTEKMYVFIGRELAQHMLGMGSAISEISIVLRDHSDLPAALPVVEKEFKTYDVASWRDLLPLVVAMRDIQDGFLTLWFFVVMLAVTFGLVNTLFMSVFERTREIGLFQALGMGPEGLILMVLFESLVLLCLGGCIGNSLSLATIEFFSDGIDISRFARGMDIAGIRSVVSPVIVVKDFLLANGMIVLVGSLGSLYPAWKASRHTPAEAIARI